MYKLALILLRFTCFPVTKTYIFDKKYSTEFNFVDGLTWRSTVYGVRIPDITVCDPNPWSRDKMEAFNVSLDMVSYLLYAYNLIPIPANSQKLNGSLLAKLEEDYHILVKR